VLKIYGFLLGLLLAYGGGAALAAEQLTLTAADFNQRSLHDLTSALTQLTASSPVKAIIAVKTLHDIGSGDDALSRTGAAQANILDDGAGLSIGYATQLLQLLATEQARRARDPDAATPTLDGLAELTLPNVQPMVHGSAALMRAMASANYQGAAAEDYQGNSARQLQFTLTQDQLTKRQRKYVKQYDGTFSVWIDEQGYPLASRTRIHARGRAFIVIRFSITIESDSHYQVYNDRLITARQTDYQLSAGAGERSERLVNKTLEVLDERHNYTEQ